MMGKRSREKMTGLSVKRRTLRADERREAERKARMDELRQMLDARVEASSIRTLNKKPCQGTAKVIRGHIMECLTCENLGKCLTEFKVRGGKIG